MVKQQLLSEDGQYWLQFQWSAEQERLIPTTAQPLSVKQAHDIIREVQEILQTPGILLRFHALKPLHKTQARDGSAVVPWKMLIGHRETSAVAAPPALVPQCGDAACTRPHAIRELTWSSSNDSIWCYMDSCVWGLMWSLTYMQRPLQARGRLSHVARAVAQHPGTPLKLTQCSAHTPAMRRWCSTHSHTQQQDGAEFWASVLAGLTTVSWGPYESRRQALLGENQTHDLSTPLWLHMPMQATFEASMPSVELQALIIQWHEDHQWLQALSAPHDVLCIQLSRGQACNLKDHTQVFLSGFQVHVPVFTGADLDIHWHPYRVRACVLHQGDATTCGHFQAVLFDREESWIADDNRPPARCSASPGQGLANNMYILWLAKAPGPAVGSDPLPEVQNVASLRSVLSQYF